MQDVEGWPTTLCTRFVCTVRMCLHVRSALSLDSSLDMQCTNAMPGYVVMSGVLSHKGGLRQVIYSAALPSRLEAMAALSV